jgi:hypothetical protein
VQCWSGAGYGWQLIWCFVNEMHTTFSDNLLHQSWVKYQCFGDALFPLLELMWWMIRELGLKMGMSTNQFVTQCPSGKKWSCVDWVTFTVRLSVRAVSLQVCTCMGWTNWHLFFLIYDPAYMSAFLQQKDYCSHCISETSWMGISWSWWPADSYVEEFTA